MSFKPSTLELTRRYAQLQGRTPLRRDELEMRLHEEVRELRHELLSGHLMNREEIADEIADVAMILEEIAYQFLGVEPRTCIRDKISRKFQVDPDR